MRIEQLDTRKAEIGVGAAIMVIAAIAVAEAAKIGTGWGPSGPQPGFFPFISGLILLASVGGVILQALRSRRTSFLFGSRDEASEVLKVGLPLVGAIASVQYLGLYVMAALYIGLFSYWYGRHRWFVSLTAAILLPLVLYFTFERGFRIALPKSVLYGDVVPF